MNEQKSTGRKLGRVLVAQGLVTEDQISMATARQLNIPYQQQAAISTMRRSQPYASDRPDYAAFLAALLQSEGRHKEAIEQYHLQAARMAPQNGVWWMGLGISLQADNRQEEAGEAFLNARQSGTLSADLQAFVEQRMAQLQNK